MFAQEIDLPEEYKRGYAKFLGCKIDLSKRVLIPRPETEFWVGKVLRRLRLLREAKPPTQVRPVYALDMFAGSGCVGIAVLKNIKNSHCDFADIDKKAAEQIKINLRINKISSQRYKIYQSDIFERLKGKKYDYIFANPPYVAKERIGEVQPSVLKYEPKIALLAGKKGLDIIKKFLKEAKKYLKAPAFAPPPPRLRRTSKASAGKSIIFMEFDSLQKKDIESILIKQRYREFKFNKDQFNQWRWLVIHY